MKRRFLLPALAAAISFAPFSAKAGEPRLLDTYNMWNTYTYMDNGHKTCYMAAKSGEPAPPKKPDEKMSGKTPERGDPYAIITHRPADGTRNVFSYIAGYHYKPGATVTLQIDDQKFDLFTKDDTAWAADADMDNKIAKAIQGGKTMTVSGSSAKGKKTMDTFDLKGASDAHDQIDKECR